MRTVARRDANEAAIVAALRQCGVTVHLLDTPCDLLVCYRGKWQPLEVKTARGKLTKAQRADHLLAPIPVVRDFAEACQAIGLRTGGTLR